jgi:ASCH domain
MSAPDLALSIRQPWAWLILHAGKDIENRTWPTRFRGPVLIHASKAWGWKEKEDRDCVIFSFGIAIPETLPLGGIVGEARIVDCVEHHASRWFNGPFGFVLADAKQGTFIPCRGALGFFNPTT